MKNLGSNTLLDWSGWNFTHRPGNDHPILRGLYGKPLRTRTVLAIWRDLAPSMFKRSPHPSCTERSRRGRRAPRRSERSLGDLTYAQFLVELNKPNGGMVGETYNVGPSMIEELRSVLAEEKRQLEVYGYA